MISVGHSFADNLMVVFSSGSTSGGDDYRRLFDGFDELFAKAKGRPGRPACVYEVDESYSPADALWRSRTVEHRQRALRPGAVLDFALVSSSTTMRGVITSMLWASAPTDPSAWFTCPSVNDAARWLETRRRRPLPSLSRLVGDVHGRAASAAAPSYVMRVARRVS